MKHTLISLLVFFSCATSSNKHLLINNKLIYQLPLPIEIELSNLVNKKMKEPFFIFRNNDDYYSIQIQELKLIKNSNDIISKKLLSTKRLLQIDSNAYPIVFDYDFDFATSTDESKLLSIEDRLNLINSGESYLIPRLTILSEGFYLTFKKNEIIEKNW